MIRTTKEQFSFKWQLKFIAMICFICLLFFMKIVTGQVTKSMALVADSFHMITDMAALIVGFIALRLANSRIKKAAAGDDKFTFGWIRVEVLGGLINTVLLLALCFSILVTALKRFVQPETITKPVPVVIVGGVSLLVNLIGLFMFRTSRENLLQFCRKPCGDRKGSDGVETESLMTNGDDELTERREQPSGKRKRTTSHGHEVSWEHEYLSPHSLNIRGVYLHILEHFLASIIVIASAILSIFYQGEVWVDYIDPACTVLVVTTILYSTVPLFRETLILFMQSVPANIQINDMEERLIKYVPEVLSVHEFHVWHLGGDKVVGSAHILYKTPMDFHNTLQKVKLFFQLEGIACMTFQPEFLPDGGEQPDLMLSFSPAKCYFRCSDKDCETLTCCAVHDEGEKESINATEECSISPDVTSLNSLT